MATAVAHKWEFTSSRDFMRVIAGPAYGLRRERVIRSEVQIQAVDGQLVRKAYRSPWMTDRE